MYRGPEFTIEQVYSRNSWHFIFLGQSGRPYLYCYIYVKLVFSNCLVSSSWCLSCHRLSLINLIIEPHMIFRTWEEWKKDASWWPELIFYKFCFFGHGHCFVMSQNGTPRSQFRITIGFFQSLKATFGNQNINVFTPTSHSTPGWRKPTKLPFI